MVKLTFEKHVLLSFFMEELEVNIFLELFWDTILRGSLITLELLDSNNIDWAIFAFTGIFYVLKLVIFLPLFVLLAVLCMILLLVIIFFKGSFYFSESCFFNRSNSLSLKVMISLRSCTSFLCRSFVASIYSRRTISIYDSFDEK